MIARARVEQPTVQAAVAEAMKKIKGAYSLVVMSPKAHWSKEIHMALDRCVSESVAMPIYWHQKAVHLTLSVLNLSVT